MYTKMTCEFKILQLNIADRNIIRKMNYHINSPFSWL